jgi:hypothetical protein
MNTTYKNLQSGSAHLIVIIVLVVALLGTLGFVFWQNFINKSAASNTATTAEESSKKTGDQEEYCSTYEKLCFDYPKTWSITGEATDIDQQSSDSLTIKNDKGDTVGTVLTGLSGLGGTCDSSAPGVPRVNVISREASEITDITVKLYTAEGGTKKSSVDALTAVVYIEDKGYYPVVYLSDPTDVAYLAEGSTIDDYSTCFANLIAGYPPQHLEYGTVHAVNTGAGFNNGTATYYPTKAEAETALKSSDLTTLYTIFKSAHY